jgi:hypothetical protein
VSLEFVPGLRYRSGAQQLWALLVESFAGWKLRVNELSTAAGLFASRCMGARQARPPGCDLAKGACGPAALQSLHRRRTPPTGWGRAGSSSAGCSLVVRRINIVTVTAKGRQVRERLVYQLFDPPGRSAASARQTRRGFATPCWRPLAGRSPQRCEAGEGLQYRGTIGDLLTLCNKTGWWLANDHGPGTQGPIADGGNGLARLASWSFIGGGVITLAMLAADALIANTRRQRQSTATRRQDLRTRAQWP